MSFKEYKRDIGFNKQGYQDQRESLGDFFDSNIAPGFAGDVATERRFFINDNITAKKTGDDVKSEKITEDVLSGDLFRQFAPDIVESVLPDEVSKILKPFEPEVATPTEDKGFADNIATGVEDFSSRVIDQMADDYSSFAKELYTGLERSNTAEFAGNIGSAVTGLPFQAETDQPDSFVGEVGRDIGSALGDLPLFYLTKSPSMAFAMTSMMGHYNKLKREGKDFKLKDIPKTAGEGLAGAITGQVFKLGGILGTKGSEKIAGKLKGSFLKDVPEKVLGESIAKFAGRPLADTALLSANMAIRERRLPTGREIWRNFLSSIGMETVQTIKPNTRSKKYTGKESDDISKIDFEETNQKALDEGKIVSDAIPAEKSAPALTLSMKSMGIDGNSSLGAIDDHVIASLNKYNKGGEIRRVLVNETLKRPELPADSAIKRINEVPKKLSTETIEGYNQALIPQENIRIAETNFTKYENQIKKMVADGQISESEAGVRLAEPRQNKNNFVTEVTSTITNKAKTGFNSPTIAEFSVMAHAPKTKEFAGEGIKNFPREIERTLGASVHDLIITPLRQDAFLAEREFGKKSQSVVAHEKKFSKADKKRARAVLLSEQGYYDGDTFINTGERTLKKMKEEFTTRDDLTKEQADYLKFFEDDYRKIADQINDSNKISGLPEMKRLDGELSYAPMLRRFSSAESLGQLNDNWNSRKYEKRMYEREGGIFQHAISRGESVRAIELDLAGAYKVYMRSAMKNIYMNPSVAMVREYMKPMAVPVELQGKMVNGKKLGKVWNMQEDNPHMFDYISERLSLIDGRGHKLTRVDRVAQMLSQNTAMAVLSGNVGTVLNQFGAIDGTLTEFGSKYTAIGLDLALDPKAFKQMMRESKTASIRVHDAHSDVKTIGKGKINKARLKLADIGLKGMKYTDMWSYATTYWSAKTFAMDELGLKGQEAINYADKKALGIQGGASTLDMSGWQSTPKGKALLLFQTFVINKFNWLTDDVLLSGKKEGEYSFGGKKIKNVHTARALNLGKYMAYGAIVNSLYNYTGSVYGTELKSANPAPIDSAVEKLEEKRLEAEKENRSLILDDYTGVLWSGFVEAMSLAPGGSALKYGGEGIFGAVGKSMADAVEAMNPDTKSERRWAIFLKSMGMLGGIAGTVPIYKGLSANHKALKEEMKEQRANSQRTRRKRPQRKRRSRRLKPYIDQPWIDIKGFGEIK